MRPRILPISGPAQSGVVDGAGGRIVYWAWRETSGATSATFRLWDGSNNGGALIAPITLQPNESVREFPGFHSLPYRVGLFLEVLSGSVEGQITVVPWREGDSDFGVPVIVVGTVDLQVNEILSGG